MSILNMGFVLTLYEKYGYLWADLPSGINEPTVCYFTTNPNSNQSPSYERRLEKGHDYSIMDNKIKTNRTDLKKGFIFIPSENKEITCPFCLNKVINSNFCSFCRTKL